MAWEKVWLLRELGGLGIWRLVPFNWALLGKWLWKYSHETTHLWQTVIAMKYGEGKGRWSTRVCRRAHVCGLWRSICEGWESFSKHKFFLWWVMVLVFFFGIISGLGIILLKLFILSYLMCSTNKETCIYDVLSPPVGGNDRVWNLKF